jgi:hypothetical protein
MTYFSAIKQNAPQYTLCRQEIGIWFGLVDINMGFMMQLSTPILIDSILEHGPGAVGLNAEVLSVLVAD